MLMQIDNDADEELSYSEESDDDLDKGSSGPWQFGLYSIQERTVALFNRGDFTDITLTFPGTDITYDVHRLILAISSPVFEGICYGPMKTEGTNVELNGDDPSAMEYVIAYCYGNDLTIDDINLTLEVYKLADKYILDGLKNQCCKHIVSHMSKDNVKDLMEFAVKFNFNDFMKPNCISYLGEMLDDMQEKYKDSRCCDDEPDFTYFSSILMDINDDWIEELASGVIIYSDLPKILDFHDSWINPESPLNGNRLTAIMNDWNYIEKFYGCIDNNAIQLFHPRRLCSTELYLSVMDPHHAKRLIDILNQQNRFVTNLIAIHIRCEEFWPSDWSPIQIERTHRPSILLISDADDDKIAWIVEAAKALLPQSQGSFTRVFGYDGRYIYEDGERIYERLRPINILKLPRSKLTPNGLNTLLVGLFSSGMAKTKILLQSPYIESNAQAISFRQYNLTIQCLPMDHNFFRKVFEDFPRLQNQY